ncbi:MAG: hypothetical protein NT167_22345 [Verrucomicrobia bacterium]|nr:hypothetical protein [Verrucomicrobiota bacterium]
MRIALYQGTSFISRLIRWQTRSRYSHAAWLGDNGNVIEAWQPCVRVVSGLSEQHTPGTVVDLFEFVTPLRAREIQEIWRLALKQVGTPYDYLAVLRFVSRKASRERWEEKLFCSEMVFGNARDAGRELLARTEAWRVPPDWIARSPLLRLSETVVTT